MRIVLVFVPLALAVAGCAPTAVPPTPASPPHGTTQSTTSFVPLLIDRNDLRLGTTVQFARIPTERELNDLPFESGLARVVLALPEWPADYAALQALERRPQGIEIVVVLHGYAPSRAAADAWDYFGGGVRIIVIVDGPPPTPVEIEDLNGMRGLERVIVRMKEPARRGFDRLQRPLSFWKRID